MSTDQPRSPEAHVVLLWDLDGTLLTTARAGIVAFEAGAESVLGMRPDLSELYTAGLTDAQIAALIIERCGVQPEDSLIGRLLSEYELGLPECLPLRRGRVMPRVPEVLEDLSGRADVTSLLLTGNTAAGARAKLRHYGLDGLISDGAFCTGPGDRTAIANAARKLARDRLGPAADPRLFVIGDTPHDVACGKAIGAATIAVATGPAPIAELRASEPWTLLEVLPPPADFRALIGLR